MATLCKSAVNISAKASARPARAAVVVRAQNVDVNRRAALGAVAGAAALLSGAAPSLAAFGDSANVFGKTTNPTGFVPYTGEGFAILLPSKWNPSKEQDNAGVALRYEDNFDAVNNLTVYVSKTDKKSIEDYGAPEAFIPNFAFLFGKQAFSGETLSEGGFAPNRVSAASLLDISTRKDKKGKTYYQYEYLSRTADGNEGGRHVLVSATVSSDGQLYLLKIQEGDKRWFKGANKEALGAQASFVVA